MTDKVYRYGLLPPTVGVDKVGQQLFAAHQYYNKLTEIELQRRTEVEKIRLAYDTISPLKAKVDAIEVVLESAVAALKRLRRKDRTDEMRTEIKRLRDEKKAAKCAVREEKKRVREAGILASKEEVVNEAANVARKDARATTSAYWGTYLITENAEQASRGSSHGLPDFRRWKGIGSLAVQIQHGISVEQLFSCTDTRLQIVPPPSTAWDRQRSKEQRTVVRLRVGSDGIKPIWAEWPLLMHRPIPEAGRITWAKVKKERLADKDRWTLHLTVAFPDGYVVEPCGKGRIAVDIGWRKFPDGLRVAYTRDEGGEEQDIRLDPGVIPVLRKGEDLQSIRDNLLNEMVQWLSEWKKTGVFPAESAAMTAYLLLWKSQRRMGKLAWWWKNNRFAGDEEAFAKIEEWRKKDRHLWQWQDNARDQVLRRRLHQYRMEAVRLARRYGELVIEDFDLSKVAKHELPESKKVENAEARWHQRAAACSVFRNCLIEAFEGRGGRVIRINPAMSTQECHLCGCKDRWDAVPFVMHKCEKCGEEWDQDKNAAINLLRWSFERLDAIVEPKPKRLPKWRRLGRHNGGARKEAVGAVE